MIILNQSLEIYFYQYGPPDKMLSDQEREFVNKVYK